MSRDNQVSTNMPVLSVEKTIRTLSRSYCTVIGKGLSPKILPSVMLWGPPGVGIKGRLFESGTKLNVTGFDELRTYIQQELQGLIIVPHEADLSAEAE